MLDDVELNHNGEQYILVQNERNIIHFTSSESNESYVIIIIIIIIIILACAKNLLIWRHTSIDVFVSEHKRTPKYLVLCT